MDYENYEYVLGRKLSYCNDCEYVDKECYYNNPFSIYCKLKKEFFGINNKKCGFFRISDKIKAMMQLIMNDCDRIGIDIHPKYKIGVLHIDKYYTCKNGYVMHCATHFFDLELKI